MSAKTRELVDGTGAARVLASMSKIRLRPTLPEDSQLLWRWANDPQVRAMSFSTEPIPWERHAAWFSTKLSDPSALLYIATDTSGRQIGHIRYEVDGARAAVSLSVAPEFRGIGYGKKMLLLGIEELFRGSGTKAVDAFVKPCNTASLRVFEAAGFRNEGTIRVRGQEAIHLRVTRTH
jgi:RimJ/RimL family protein N-acetyltransferase